MTRDEILALSPGHELDGLVASKVMGYIVDQDWYKWCHEDSDEFHYSSNIVAAINAAERVGTYQLTKLGVGHGKPKYRATVKANKYTVYAETAAEALSKSVIMAVMSD